MSTISPPNVRPSASRTGRRPRSRMMLSLSIVGLLLLLLMVGRSVAQDDRGGRPGGPPPHGGDPLGGPDFDPLFSDPEMIEAWIEQLQAEEWPQGPRRRDYPWLDMPEEKIDARKIVEFVASLVERHQDLERRREKVRDAAYKLREEFEAARSNGGLLSERGKLRDLAGQRAKLHRDSEELHRDERELMMDGAVARVYIEKLESVLDETVKTGALPAEDLGEATHALEVLAMLRTSKEMSRALRIAFEDSAMSPRKGDDRREGSRGRNDDDDRRRRYDGRGWSGGDRGDRNSWPGGGRGDERDRWQPRGDDDRSDDDRGGERERVEDARAGDPQRPGDRLIGQRLGESFRSRMNATDRIQDRMQEMTAELRELRQEVQRLREEVRSLRHELNGGVRQDGQSAGRPPQQDAGMMPGFGPGQLGGPPLHEGEPGAPMHDGRGGDRHGAPPHSSHGGQGGPPPHHGGQGGDRH